MAGKKKQFTDTAEQITKANHVIEELFRHVTKNYSPPLIYKPVKPHFKNIDEIVAKAPNAKVAAEGIKLYATVKELDLFAIIKEYSAEHKLKPVLKANESSKSFDVREYLQSEVSLSPNDVLAAMSVSPTSLVQAANKSKLVSA